ncbi:hypothetical protein LX32DRAFT_387925 [Colletotrichum zoysiae]|uniref:Uncharacterized protein n=1 Tax=Colletotrichum zoysiae TaxID=1216348 RepID=A0AAD9HGH6_9PEZI|nr:hypothetical protein LX32DRAFT_387925 [Colletotrichum zoysiae]
MLVYVFSRSHSSRLYRDRSCPGLLPFIGGRFRLRYPACPNYRLGSSLAYHHGHVPQMRILGSQICFLVFLRRGHFRDPNPAQLQEAMPTTRCSSSQTPRVSPSSTSLGHYQLTSSNTPQLRIMPHRMKMADGTTPACGSISAKEKATRMDVYTIR